MLTDGYARTSWQPRSSDRSPWVRFEFDKEVSVSAVLVANGFQTMDQFGDEFLLNSRSATARVRFSDNSEVSLEFDTNERGLVRFELPEKHTRTLTLLVDRTYKGTRWSDLAVSEIEIETR